MRESISERGLRWEQVVLGEHEGCIRLAATQTKTKKARVAYMTGDVLAVMKKPKELRDCDYPQCQYVCHRDGKPFNNLIHGWKAACKRVGLEERTFHDLRRTGIRNLVRAGVPETVAMKISGHKTRSVFDRYNITSEEDLVMTRDLVIRGQLPGTKICLWTGTRIGLTDCESTSAKGY